MNPTSFRLFDSTNTELALSATGAFSYDPATMTARWTLAAPLQRNKFLAALEAGMIVDGGNAALDGEWTTSLSTYSNSGNGSPGGDLNFRFNYLPGDVSRNGQSNAGDANLLRSLGTTVRGAENYWRDVTANNQINAGDANYVASLGTLSLSGFDEPNNPPVPRGGQHFVAASLPSTSQSVSKISAADIAASSNAAISIWASSGLPASQVAQLRSVPIIVTAPGPGGYLGISLADRIVIDDNVRGWGWFVDATPLRNEEFRWGLNRSAAKDADDRSDAAVRMDLLNVVMHELGHQLGLGDDDSGEGMNNAMSERLASGTRRMLTKSTFSQGRPELNASQIDLHFAAMGSFAPVTRYRKR